MIGKFGLYILALAAGTIVTALVVNTLKPNLSQEVIEGTGVGA
jgi:fructose-specific phosphotransferase system IIC component